MSPLQLPVPQIEQGFQKLPVLLRGQGVVPASPFLPQRVQAGDILLKPEPRPAQGGKRGLGVPGQMPGHHRQHVILHPGPLQEPCPPQGPVIGPFSGPVPPEAVVARPVPVQGKPCQKVVLLEKAAPFPVQQEAVGLDGVPHRQPLGRGLPDPGHKRPVEIQPRQHRFPALEQKRDISLRRPQRFFDQGAAHLLRHDAAVRRLAAAGLVRVKAVGAVQAAPAGGGLQQDIQRRHGGPSFSPGRGLNGRPSYSGAPGGTP